MIPPSTTEDLSNLTSTNTAPLPIDLSTALSLHQQQQQQQQQHQQQQEQTEPLHYWAEEEEPQVITPSPLLLSVLDHPIVTVTQPDQPPMALHKIPPPQAIGAGQEPSLTQDLTQEEEGDTTTSAIAAVEDSQRCLLDFVEWWCHKLISAKTLPEIKSAEAEMLKAIENFGTSQCDFGRLSNRIEIAAFSLDVALLGEDSLSPSSPCPSLDQHWGLLREELILLKSKLLRQDANADVVLLTESQRQAQIKAIPCPKREQSTLFQKQYTHVDTLVRVQYNLAVFHRKLTQVIASQSGEGKRLVREAIEEYEKQINKLFGTGAAVDGDNDDTASVDSNATAASDVRELPQELAGFLLKDLYQTSANNANKSSGAASPAASESSSNSNSSSSSSSNSSTALAQRLLNHVESIVGGKGPYSQSACQTTTRKLLKEWHDMVLEQPTLVQLGYGDVGGEASPEGQPTTRAARKAIAEEDALLRRLSSSEDAIIAAAPIAAPAKFVPIRWVDSSTDEDEADSDKNKKKRNDIFEPPAHSSQRKRYYRHRTTSSSSVNTRRSVTTLYSDSEDDPEEAIFMSPRKKRRRQRRTNDDDATTVATSMSASSRHSKARKLKQEQQQEQQEQPRIRVSPAEAEAIQEGVRKFGLGRWKIVQQQANGALDKLSPQKIKVVYQQMKRKSKNSSKNNKNNKNTNKNNTKRR